MNIFVKENFSIKAILKVIDESAIKLAIVVDKNNKLLGTISDGDIRRAILNGFSLDDKIAPIYNRKPIVMKENYRKEELIQLCTQRKIYQIPVIDKDNKVIDILLLDELLKPKRYSNRVVLMVGGLGTRLKPLTKTTPKPMLHVGSKPILQIIVENFVRYGFTNITMCVGYKSNIIQDYFGDGRAFGAIIDYVVEKKRMGTAGALSLLKNKPQEVFFVMNGDLLTNVNFESMLEYHISHNTIATMAVRSFTYHVPYGVVQQKGSLIKEIEEKPSYNYFVNAGIYILDPSCLDFIPKNIFYDMPTLFNELIQKHYKTVSFPLNEYWLDIGHINDYKQANDDYELYFR
jgi:dTDP-glucose pyrophosphorylase